MTGALALLRAPGDPERAGDPMIREMALAWAEARLPDRDRLIRKAIGARLRDMSCRDPDRARAFVEAHGAPVDGVARHGAGKTP